VAVDLRVLVYNTYLLHVLGLPGGIEVAAKPGWRARAGEIGEAVAGQYEVVALTEVFDRVERKAILAGWGSGNVHHEVGPTSGRLPVLGKSSGLLTVVDGPTVVRSDRHRFAERGSRWRDADAYANKGVLLVEIDVGLAANLEVYSTHLIYGNDFWKRPGGPHGANAVVRQAQVDEVLDVVAATHRPPNVALVVGDFNVPASDPHEDPSDRDYRRMRSSFDRAGFEDVWARHGDGPGYTHFYDAPPGGICRPDPSAPDFCAEPAEPPPGGLATRIDYAWLQRPTADHRLAVAVSRLRRRSFPRRAGVEAFDVQPFLSDHLGLHLELRLS
jgi:endonuclease/exonuclease/phosphatase family metal-dependent hydrolase